MSYYSTEYAPNGTRVYKDQIGTVVAVATGNLSHTSFTQYFCLDDVWQQDSQTTWVTSEQLEDIINSEEQQTWSFDND